VKSAAKRARELATIRRPRGISKRKPGDKSFAEEWAEYKRKEKELEEAKYARCFGASRRPRKKPIRHEDIHSLRGSLKGTRVLKAMMKDRKRDQKL